MDKIDIDKAIEKMEISCSKFKKLSETMDVGEGKIKMHEFIIQELTKIKDGEYVTEDYMHLMLKKQKEEKAKTDREKIKWECFQCEKNEPCELYVPENCNDIPYLCPYYKEDYNPKWKKSKAIMSELDNK